MTARIRTLTRSGFGAFVTAAVLGVACGEAAASWSVNLGPSSAALAAAYGSPLAPAGVTATCTSPNATTVQVSWSAVSRASSYNIYDSSSGPNGIYILVASGQTGTSYTTGPLVVGTFYFEVQAVSGTQWASALSSPSAGRIIALTGCS